MIPADSNLHCRVGCYGRFCAVKTRIPPLQAKRSTSSESAKPLMIISAFGRRFSHSHCIVGCSERPTFLAAIRRGLARGGKKGRKDDGESSDPPRVVDVLDVGDFSQLGKPHMIRLAISVVRC